MEKSIQYLIVGILVVLCVITFIDAATWLARRQELAVERDRRARATEELRVQSYWAVAAALGSGQSIANNTDPRYLTRFLADSGWTLEDLTLIDEKVAQEDLAHSICLAKSHGLDQVPDVGKVGQDRQDLTSDLAYSRLHDARSEAVKALRRQDASSARRAIVGR